MTSSDKTRSDGLPWTTPDGTPLQWVRASVLARLAKPFSHCWADIDRAIRLQDIDRCLRNRKEALHAPTGWQTLEVVSPLERRRRFQQHVQKIAWFARNGFQQPLEVDVGVPSLRCYVNHPVQDGNHRLAAAIYRLRRLGEDALLPVSVGGCIETARSLGLWPEEPPDFREALRSRDQAELCTAP